MSVREPDETTIRAAHEWLENFARYADSWGVASANGEHAEAILAEVAVLTARLTEADRTMRELREALTPFALTSYGEFLPGTGAVTATIQYADLTLARAALAGERGDRHNETGGTVNVARDESGQT